MAAEGPLRFLPGDQVIADRGPAVVMSVGDDGFHLLRLLDPPEVIVRHQRDLGHPQSQRAIAPEQPQRDG